VSLFCAPAAAAGAAETEEGDDSDDSDESDGAAATPLPPKHVPRRTLCTALLSFVVCLLLTRFVRTRYDSLGMSR
jgi:hypothetical protein